MKRRGLVLLAALFNCVFSLPLTSSQPENEDVKVMKCIVDVLADVLSRPHLVPVSQECLITLKEDDRLVAILRHHNFLKELQEIAVQGGQERSQLQRDASLPTLLTQTPQTADDVADRSMLEALGGPGERSILFQKKMTDNEDETYEKMDNNVEDGESQEDGFEGEQERREQDENHKSHMSESVRRREEEAEEEEEDGSDESEANVKNVNEDKRGIRTDEQRDPHRSKTKDKKFDQEHEEEKRRRSAFLPRRHERRHEEVKGEHEEGLKRWVKRSKLPSLRTKAVGLQNQKVSNEQEVLRHSKEETEEAEEEKRSPEEQELQMIAQRTPEERRGSEEEGSASRKSEASEIESLAAIESELENVAQKLHGLRHG